MSPEVSCVPVSLPITEGTAHDAEQFQFPFPYLSGTSTDLAEPAKLADFCLSK